MLGGQIKLSADLAEDLILIPFSLPKSSHLNHAQANLPTGSTIPPIAITGGSPCPDFG